MLRCMLVCVWVIDTNIEMFLMRLKRKTQWWEANLRVGRSWVPNTFPRAFLNTKPISMIVRSMVFPQEEAIYMVPRPLQKLGSDSPLASTVVTPLGIMSLITMSYVLTLIKTISIFVCTHFTWFVCPLSTVGDEWEDGRLHLGPNLPKFIPPTHNRCHLL